MRKLFGSFSYIHLFLLLIAAVLGLAACQKEDDGEDTLADILPLDQQKPTFVFFYTDG
jgi:hypothetical protein